MRAIAAIGASPRSNVLMHRFGASKGNGSVVEGGGGWSGLAEASLTSTPVALLTISAAATAVVLVVALAKRQPRAGRDRAVRFL